MGIETYDVNIEFLITPCFLDVPPYTKIRLDQETIWDGMLDHAKTFCVKRSMLRALHALEIELCYKPDTDAHQSLAISDIVMGGITSPKFVWQGIYHPRYPEPWASQQKTMGRALSPVLSNTDHLGWNGIWCLTFSVPIFTWIHQIENLGWIYA